MFKTKLQELCQRRKWTLPKYTTAKEGRQHESRFLGTVSVEGQNFVTPAPSSSRSVKEAENTAAEIAYQHLYYSLPQYRQEQVVNPNLAVAFPALPPTGMPQEAQLVFGALFQLDSPHPSATPMPRLLGTKNDAQLTKPNNEEPVSQILQTHRCDINSGPVDFTCNKGLLGTKNDAQQTKPNNEEPVSQILQTHRCDVNSGPVDFTCNKEILRNCKNLLREYAQKQIMGLPEYTCEIEGPPHNRQFKAKVSLNGRSFGTLESFPTLKEAERAAAKVACQDLLVNQRQEDGWPYKRLLKEFAQKKDLCPLYETSMHGIPHMPVFKSSVNIGTDTFQGAEAKTKKQAETNAAKVAYYALIDSRTTEPSKVSSGSQSAVVDNVVPPAIKQSTLPTEKPENAEDSRITESSKVSSGNQSAVVDNVDAAPAIKQCRTTEKRKKPEGPHLPYDGVDNPASVDPIDEQRAKHMRLSKFFRRKTSSPAPHPHCLSALPCQLVMKSRSLSKQLM